MRVLAFDCAGAQCAAALLDGARIVAADRFESERGHAQRLMPLLIGLVKGAGLEFRDIDRFAVTTGPGSFTGIRVALAAAHGLAIGTGRPVVGVTVFEALAAAAVAAQAAAPRLLVAVESRRAECFLQLFDGDGRPLAEPAMLPPEAVPAWIGDGPLAVAGDAAGRVMPFLTRATALGPDFQRVEPGILARLAAARTPGAAAPAPFYLRAPDAKPGPSRPGPGGRRQATGGP